MSVGRHNTLSRRRRRRRRKEAVSLSASDGVNEEDSERDRATQV